MGTSARDAADGSDAAAMSAFPDGGKRKHSSWYKIEEAADSTSTQNVFSPIPPGSRLPA